MGNHKTLAPSSKGPFHLRQERLRLLRTERLYVVIILQHAAERFFDRLRVKMISVQLHEGAGPVEGLGDSGGFIEPACSDSLHEVADLLGEPPVDVGEAASEDRDLFFEAGGIDPEVEAAPPQRVA